MRHTAGPWQVNGGAVEQAETPGRLQTYMIASVYGADFDDRPESEQEANCRLIAAAPELLMELRACHNGQLCARSVCRICALIDRVERG